MFTHLLAQAEYKIKKINETARPLGRSTKKAERAIARRRAVLNGTPPVIKDRPESDSETESETDYEGRGVDGLWDFYKLHRNTPYELRRAEREIEMLREERDWLQDALDIYTKPLHLRPEHFLREAGKRHRAEESEK
jgi:hypothetical protein